VVNVREYLRKVKYVTISVIDEDGTPWAVPVAVQKYHDGRLEWFSKADTVHSKAISRNAAIAISAFTTKQDEQGEYGFYAKAVARKKLPLPTGLGLYEAEITEAWYNDERHNKKPIDKKEL
jgi:hypothetical protein